MRHLSSFLIVASVTAACGGESGRLWRGTEERFARETRFANLLDAGRQPLSARVVRDDPGPHKVYEKQALIAAEADAHRGYAAWLGLDANGSQSFGKDDDLLAAALKIVAEQRSLAVEPADLKPAERAIVALTERLVSVNFNRFVDGVRVKDAFVEVIFWLRDDERFALREIVNKSYGGIAVAGASRQWETDEILELTGRDDLVLLRREPMILPRPVDGGDVDFVRGTAVEAMDPETEERYTLYLADESRELVEAQRDRVSASRLQANVHQRTWIENKKEPFAIPLARVNTANGMVTLGHDGEGDLPAGNVTVILQGARGTVVNNTSSTPISFSAEVAGPETTIPILDPALGAMNSYIAVQRINGFARRHLSESDTDGYMASNVSIKVNVAGACNAFYDPQSNQISLYAKGTAQGTSCGNMAEVNDVIYHEWGHGLDNYTGRNRGINDGAYSEGIGDILSGYYTGSPNLGPGFRTDTTNGLRTLEHAKKYPGDLKNEVHADGEIIGGTFWDLRKGLIARHGEVKGAYLAERLFLKNLMTTEAYTESYRAVLRLDDDDGNEATRSPNYCTINAAFAKHGLATAENCTDAAPQMAVPTDTNLALGIQTRTDKAARLMAAGTNVAAMSVCLGTREVCDKSKKEDIAFDFEGDAGSKVFFVAKTMLDLTGPTDLTVMAKDAAGKIIGMRGMRITGR